MKKLLLSTLLTGAVTTQMFATADIQIVHNAADPAAAEVDVYLGAALILDDFAFRTATEFLTVPSGIEITVSVAPSTSTSVADAIASFSYTLEDGQRYIAVANGVLNPALFAANPEGAATAFNILVKADVMEAAGTPGNVDFFVLHGATDAPAVNVFARGVAQLVTGAEYTNFTDYISVPAGSYIVDITPAGAVIPVVAAFTADLSGLGGGTAAVMASGFLNPAANQDGPAFALIAVLNDGTVITLPAAPTATLQVIHNSADPAAVEVDVYIAGVKTVDNFAFRTATPALNIPSGVPVSIGIAPGTSMDAGDIIATFDITFDDNETYVALANGVLDPGMFAVNPDGNSTAFTLFSAADIRLTANDPTKVEFIAVHGATDAPTVDVRVGGTELVNDAAYGDITGYVAVDPAVYTLDVTTPDGAVTVASYAADLSGLTGGTAVVFASGFLDPMANNDGEAFGLFAALTDGTVVPFNAITVDIENTPVLDGLSVYPNPASSSIQINNNNAAGFVTNIYSIDGRLMLNTFAAPGVNSVDISNLTSGLYTVVIADGAAVYTSKLSVIK